MYNLELIACIDRDKIAGLFAAEFLQAGWRKHKCWSDATILSNLDREYIRCLFYSYMNEVKHSQSEAFHIQYVLLSEYAGGLRKNVQSETVEGYECMNVYPWDTTISQEQEKKFPGPGYAPDYTKAKEGVIELHKYASSLSPTEYKGTCI